VILVFEHDSRDHGSGRFAWRPGLFCGRWGGGRTWRLSWGVWSISYYPSPGLRDFFARVESGATEWVTPPPGEGGGRDSSKLDAQYERLLRLKVSKAQPPGEGGGA
jgi:hypothetical protein